MSLGADGSMIDEQCAVRSLLLVASDRLEFALSVLLF